MGNVTALVVNVDEHDEHDEQDVPNYDIFNPDVRPIIPDNWQTRALCIDVDEDIFFPDGNDTESRDQAKAICAQCPVQEECLATALLHRECTGIWGGKTERERKAMLKGRQSWRQCTICQQMKFDSNYKCCRG